MKLNLIVPVNGDYHWVPPTPVEVMYEPPQYHLIYDHQGNIVSTQRTKEPIGYVTTR